MNEPTVKITRKQAANILAATFPTYHGRKIKVVFTEKLTFYDTNWSGGTKNFYAAVNANGTHAKLNVPAPWNNPVEGLTIQLPVDVIIAERSYFCGTDLGITLYAHPVHLPKWLPAGAVTAAAQFNS